MAGNAYQSMLELFSADGPKPLVDADETFRQQLHCVARRTGWRRVRGVQKRPCGQLTPFQDHHLENTLAHGTDTTEDTRRRALVGPADTKLMWSRRARSPDWRAKPRGAARGGEQPTLMVGTLGGRGSRAQVEAAAVAVLGPVVTRPSPSASARFTRPSQHIHPSILARSIQAAI